MVWGSFQPAVLGISSKCMKIWSQKCTHNIIEAVWDLLDREMNKRQPTSKEELWNVPQETWRTIPENYLKKLNLGASTDPHSVKG